MKSKTSLFNKGVFLNSLKRFGWVGVLYFIIMFLTIPIGLLYKLSNYDIQFIKENLYHIQGIFDFHSPLVFLPMVSIPVFIGIMLFRYIQNKNTIDLIHSLPIKRESLFIANIIVGLLLIILPVLLIALISIIILSSFGLSQLFNIVLYWIIVTILFSIVFFSVSVFCGIITGISTLQGVLTYILLFLPYGLTTLIMFNLKNLFYGFIYNYTLEQKLIKLSPITRMFDNLFTRVFNNDYTSMFIIQEIIIYPIVSIIIIIISYYLYKLRKTESAAKSITFNVLKPIFKYGITFSSMLLAGLIYGETTNSYSWMIFGYIVGSLIGYFIAEIIMKKTFYVFKNIKGYLIYAVVIVIIFMGIHLDVIGFENKIPNEEDISAVSFYNFEFDGLKSKENINEIRNFHKEVIQNKEIYRDYDGPTRYLYLGYKLKNGRYIFREYKVPSEIYKKYTRTIIESVEFKKTQFQIFKYKASDIKEVNLHHYKFNKRIRVTNKNDLTELKTIIENKIINMKYGDWYDDEGKMSIEIVYEYKNTNEGFKRDYISTLPNGPIEKWLSEKGYIN